MDTHRGEEAAIRKDLLRLKEELAALQARAPAGREPPWAVERARIREAVHRHPLAAVALAFLSGAVFGRMKGR